VGCFIGDHTKTGLGTLINTGTSVGVCCNLLPAGLLPRFFPSFSSWWNGRLVENGDLSRLLSTAEEAMYRRGCPFTETHAALFRHLFDLTASDRYQALQGGELRKLRRSA
jgi:hypothetical protein